MLSSKVDNDVFSRHVHTRDRSRSFLIRKTGAFSVGDMLLYALSPGVPAMFVKGDSPPEWVYGNLVRVGGHMAAFRPRRCQIHCLCGQALVFEGRCAHVIKRPRVFPLTVVDVPNFRNIYIVRFRGYRLSVGISVSIDTDCPWRFLVGTIVDNDNEIFRTLPSSNWANNMNSAANTVFSANIWLAS